MPSIDREKHNAYTAKWRAENPEKLKGSLAKWRANNLQKIRENSRIQRRKYRKSHPERRRNAERGRERRKKLARNLGELNVIFSQLAQRLPE